MICLVITAVAQVNLPEVVVRAAKPKPKPGAAAHVRPAPAPAARVVPAPAVTPAEQLAARTTALNQGLNTIYAPTGTAPTTISQTLSRRCHRERTQRSKRQLPGVTQDSAASGSLHVRNEHANVQIRINGIMFPDGVSDFATFLDTALIGPSFTSD